MKKKLAIIVPYRDRSTHLNTFISYMESYLKDYTYEIIVVNQSDEQLFNRGKLLNIGAKYAIDNGFDYMCFHDVDMLPKTADYSYPEYPTSLFALSRRDASPMADRTVILKITPKPGSCSNLIARFPHTSPKLCRPSSASTSALCFSISFSIASS